MPDAPQFRFGVIADVQYCDCPASSAMNRYYSQSTNKLAEALDTFARHELRFILDLGDLIDRDFNSFDTILPVYEAARAPVHRTLGNHDYTVNVTHLEEIPQRLGLDPAGYYAVNYDSWRLLVLNGNEVSLFATRAGTPQRQRAERMLEKLQKQEAPNAQEWNGGVSETQLGWLDRQLAEAQQNGQLVIVAGHYPLYPAGGLNLWNDAAVIAVLERYPAVRAYFNGHHHDGNYGHRNGIHYLNFKGMVDTATENTYAIVDVYPDRLEVQGFGREENRILT